MYSHLDKKQLVRLEERLKEWQNTLNKINTFEKNKQPLDMLIVENFGRNTISVKYIANDNRPVTQFYPLQRAHTVAYSAITRSLMNLFNDVNFEKLKELLRPFHKELNIIYVISITFDSLNYKGRNPVLGKLDLHDLKTLSDTIFNEIFHQNGSSLQEVIVLLKLYLTSFLFMHNRLVEATVDQGSTNRGEKTALERLEELEKHGVVNIKDSALQYLVKLIDQEAVKTALNKHNYNARSLVCFQILGIYRLVSAFPKLSKELSLHDLFSRNSQTNENLVSCLTHIIFHPKLNEQSSERNLVVDSLALLYDAYQFKNPIGTLREVH